MTDAQWQLTATAAELYEQIVVRYILGPWAPLLADAAQLSMGARVLDVACGTGAVARVAAAAVGATGRVTGVDLNSGMIAVARTLPASPGAEIEWLQRDALDLQLPDASYDVVVCQQGLQFFPDKLRALREMHRVLAPGGRLAISVWNSIGIYNGAVGTALRQILGDHIAKRFCASREFPPAEELIRLANDANFSSVALRVAQLDIRLPSPNRFALDHLAATPIASAITNLDAHMRESIGSCVQAQLTGYCDESGITYPEETHILTAQVT